MEDPKTIRRLIKHLEQFVSENKLGLIERILAERTRAVTVVLDDIYQPHNASAVLRTCECFGVQDVHIIENLNAYQINPDVVMGSTKWLSLYRYRVPQADNAKVCMDALKNQGYLIVATSLDEDTVSLPDLRMDKKLALCFGTEEIGLSQTVLNCADIKMKIPMHGFTQSFNISVSVAICLYDLIGKLKREQSNWNLTEKESDSIRLHWLERIVKNADIITRHFLRNHSSIQE